MRKRQSKRKSQVSTTIDREPQKIVIDHNPYLGSTEITINGREIESDSKLFQYRDRFFQEWVDDLPGLLAEETNDNVFKIDFWGTTSDYQDLVAACKVSEGKRFELDHHTDGIIEDFTGKERELRELFEELRSAVPDAFTEDVVKAFEKMLSNVLEVHIVATMSAGKSTLINALLRKKLMPSMQDACTAKITRITDKNDMEDWHADVYNRSSERTQSIDGIDIENMKLLNEAEDVSEIHITGNIPFVSSCGISLQLIDTPGVNNSRDPNHRLVTEHALDESSKMLVIFVMDADHLHTDDQERFFSKIADSMRSGGVQSRERFIFVINKMDNAGPDDDITTKLKTTEEYLAGHGIVSPNIFPVAALPALLVHRYRIAKDDQAKDSILIDEELDSKARKLIRRDALHLENYPKLPASCRAKIDKELREAQSSEDIYREALIHTGIRGIEETINLYVTKYCLPQKIREAVRILKDHFDAARAIEDANCSLCSHSDKLDAIHKKIQSLTQELRSKEKGKTFKKKIDDLDIETEFADALKAETGKFITMLTDFVRGIPSEMEQQEAERKIHRFNIIANDVQTRFFAAAESLIEKDIIAKGDQLVEEYKRDLSEMVKEIIGNDIVFDLGAYIHGDLMTIDPIKAVADSISIKKTKRKVEKSIKVEKYVTGLRRLLTPWNWFNNRYYVDESYIDEVDEEQEYIDRGKLESKLSAIESYLLKEQNKALAFSRDATNNMKTFFKRRFDQIDKILIQKTEELAHMTSDKEVAERNLKKAEERLEHLGELRRQLDKMLDLYKRG